MIITTYGLSCMQIVSRTPKGGDITLLVDPLVSQKEGGQLPRHASAQVVAVSHDVPEANNISEIEGKPFIVSLPGEYEIGGLFIYAIDAPRSAKGSSPHRIFHIESEDIHLAHLGFLDRPLSETELQSLENIDILMIPTGGGSVLNPSMAAEVIRQIEPRVIIPMNYGGASRASVEDFCRELGVGRREEGTKYKVTRKDLPEEDVMVMVLARD